MPRFSTLALALLFALPLSAAEEAPVVPTILCYHEVDAAPEHATIPRRTASGDATSEQLRYTATPEQFREELDYLDQPRLQRHGARGPRRLSEVPPRVAAGEGWRIDGGHLHERLPRLGDDKRFAARCAVYETGEVGLGFVNVDGVHDMYSIAAPPRRSNTIAGPKGAQP
jgi:hypothetical protein